VNSSVVYRGTVVQWYSYSIQVQMQVRNTDLGGHPGYSGIQWSTLRRVVQSTVL
jgi:hypothetical protein